MKEEIVSRGSDAHKSGRCKKDGIKVKTFTSCWENKINEVSEDYFSVIKNVLKETTGWTEEKNKYLCSQLLKTYFFGYLIELPLIFLPF